MHANKLAPAGAEGCTFNGLTDRQAKRRALTWWYSHQRDLGGMSVQEFFARCRISHRGGLVQITYHGEGKAA